VSTDVDTRAVDTEGVGTEVVDSPDDGFHRLRVAAIERLCEDAVAVTFDVPEELRSAFEFRPGQYLTLRQHGDAGEERRSYSICAPVGTAPRVGVRRVATGLFSEWLVDRLSTGDEVEVGPPAGNFTPELQPGTHHGLIAAGSGITPVLSIAASVLASHPDTTVTLLYGNRRTDTVMFTEDLADLKNAYGPRLNLMHVLSREPMEADIFFGRLDSEKIRELLTALVDTDDVDHWWLCGPLGMTDAAVEVLTGLGVERKRVHRELFYVDEPPPELHHEAHPAAVGVRARLRAEDPRRRAVRVQGRSLRHLPREAHRRRRDHAAQLRTGAGRARRGIRPHLPEPARIRAPDGGFRQLTNGRWLAEGRVTGSVAKETRTLAVAFTRTPAAAPAVDPVSAGSQARQRRTIEQSLSTRRGPPRNPPGSSTWRAPPT
jgi:ring-1,2-phenylacetyl-CoA epoxidase subunit PaaE